MALDRNSDLYENNPLSPTGGRTATGVQAMIDDRRMFYERDRRYRDEGEYIYSSLNRSLVESELLLPNGRQGIDLVKSAAYLVQAQHNMQFDASRGFGYGRTWEEIFAYAKDILFVNYTKEGVECRDGECPRGFPFPPNFDHMFKRVRRYRFNYPLECLHSYHRYNTVTDRYCIIVPVPQIVPIMEKLCWESMLGSNSYYQSVKMSIVMGDPSKFGLEGTQASVSAKLLTKTAAIEVNGRRFLPEQGNQQ
jgi:hypothetical protein